MRHDFLDRYSRLDSRIHRSSPPAKLLCAVGFILLTISIPFSHPEFFGIIGIALTVLLLVSRIPLIFFFKRLFTLELVVIGIALLSLFQPDGGFRFLSIIVRSTLCIFSIVLLSNTTQFSELLGVLRRLHVPAILITVLALMYRYLFVLIDETERMRRARMSRTFVRRRTTAWYSLATMIGQLFIRTSERAERIYAAMAARGWK